MSHHFIVLELLTELVEGSWAQVIHSINICHLVGESPLWILLRDVKEVSLDSNREHSLCLNLKDSVGWVDISEGSSR